MAKKEKEFKVTDKEKNNKIIIEPTKNDLLNEIYKQVNADTRAKKLDLAAKYKELSEKASIEENKRYFSEMAELIVQDLMNS